jgi:hypothetical protein
MLGYNSIIIGLVIPKLIENKTTPEKVLKKEYMILAIMALAIILIGLPLRLWLAPVVQTWIDEGNYLIAWLVAPLVYDNFPIFPMAGFGLFGAILGLMLAKQEKPKIILSYTGFQMVFWLTIGLLGIRLRGGIDPNLSVLHTVPGVYEDFFRHLGQLGICFLFFFLALLVFDILPAKYNKNSMKYFGWLRRYGLISLTVYMFEAMLAILVFKIFSLIPGLEGWNDSMVNAVLFGVCMAILWGFISKYWEKSGFKWSVEWIIIQLIEKLSGKKSQKYNINREEKPSNSKN